MAGGQGTDTIADDEKEEFTTFVSDSIIKTEAVDGIDSGDKEPNAIVLGGGL